MIEKMYAVKSKLAEIKDNKSNEITLGRREDTWMPRVVVKKVTITDEDPFKLLKEAGLDDIDCKSLLMNHHDKIKKVLCALKKARENWDKGVK